MTLILIVHSSKWLFNRSGSNKFKEHLSEFPFTPPAAFYLRWKLLSFFFQLLRTIFLGWQIKMTTTTRRRLPSLSFSSIEVYGNLHDQPSWGDTEMVICLYHWTFFLLSICMAYAAGRCLWLSLLFVLYNIDWPAARIDFPLNYPPVFGRGRHLSVSQVSIAWINL